MRADEKRATLKSPRKKMKKFLSEKEKSRQIESDIEFEKFENNAD